MLESQWWLITYDFIIHCHILISMWHFTGIHSCSWLLNIPTFFQKRKQEQRYKIQWYTQVPCKALTSAVLFKYHQLASATEIRKHHLPYCQQQNATEGNDQSFETIPWREDCVIQLLYIKYIFSYAMIIHKIIYYVQCSCDAYYDI